MNACEIYEDQGYEDGLFNENLEQGWKIISSVPNLNMRAAYRLAYEKGWKRGNQRYKEIYNVND